MNEFQHICDTVQQAFPHARADISVPLREDGIWTLDIEHVGQHIVVEWSSDSSFAVATLSADNFGERPEEIYTEVSDVERRVFELLRSGDETVPRGPLSLMRIRERRKVTQQQLAERMNIKQASVSGLEKRSDIHYGTLSRYIEGLDGTLVTFAIFGKTTYKIALADADSRKEGDDFI